jgi:4-hydroxybenzoate polyprenyltransferase
VLLGLKGFAQFISVERGLMLFMISVGATFMAMGSIAWLPAIYLGAIAFCLWSGVDALNNIFDSDLDLISDPSRAEYSKRLGKIGSVVAILFLALSSGLGLITRVPLVVLFIVIGIFCGILYSVPPFRLRQTACKPLVNFAVGAIPVLIVAGFSSAFSVSVMVLVLFIGITTSVNSLWEDLSDYASDLTNGARTLPIILGYRRGLFFTIMMGYCLIPLMILVGMLFQLHVIYYVILSALTAFISLNLVQNRAVLYRDNEKDARGQLKLGDALAKDFVVVAIVQTLNLMLSSYLKLGQPLPV